MILKSKVLIPVFAAALFFLFGFSLGDKAMYYFKIFNFPSENDGVDDTQLFSNITAYVHGDDLSLSNFINTAPAAATTTGTYIRHNALLTIASLDKLRADPIVSPTSTPKNRSEVNTIDSPFQVINGFSDDSDNPSSPNGLNPDRYLGIIFNSQKYKTFVYGDDKISYDNLTAGIHGKLCNNDAPPGSSFINRSNPVPIPFTVWLFGAGLIGAVGIRRKYTHRAQRRGQRA